MRSRFLTILLLLISGLAAAYTRQDTLRGSNGRGRDWWDVQKYSLKVMLDTAMKSVSGVCAIYIRSIPRHQQRDSMQIDLQGSMQIDEILFTGDTAEMWERQKKNRGLSIGQRAPLNYERIPAVREGNVWWITNGNVGADGVLFIRFHGKPRIAVHPPWDGGLVWTKDSSGKPWIAVACQGLGASAWWPCKDYQGDEPDFGIDFSLLLKSETYAATTFDETGVFAGLPPVWSFDSARSVSNYVSNGRPDTPVTRAFLQDDGYWKTFRVSNPINTYNTTFYYGDYSHWSDTLQGSRGVLPLDFHPLRYNEKKARRQWRVAKDMLRCFEYWMGPYPFYEDGYKLVEAPYLGMEHQSAVAYGNEYKMGYRGTDRSGTGIGLSFDYIVIHESGHEWFGNSITARDIADNWIHEGLTSYTETLFVEWIRGKKDAFRYAEGCWRNISNDRPVIGDYGVNDEGSGDKYDKGAAIIHMVRQLMNDDSAFRQLLRGMHTRFYHKIITTQEFEQYIIDQTGLPLQPFFRQYLRTTAIPALQYTIGAGGSLSFSWVGAEPGFIAPVRFSTDRGRHWTTVSSQAQPRFKGSERRLRRRLRFEPAGLYTIPAAGPGHPESD